MRVDSEIREKLFDESNTSFEARKLWYAFKDSIFYENRIFVRHQLLDIVSQYMEKNTLNVKAGQIYYRARVIDDSCINDHMMYKCYSDPDEKN